jgi:prophage DNA circulation protein
MALPTVGDLVSSINPFGASNLGQWNLARGVYTQKNTIDPSASQSIVFFYETKKGEDPTQRTAVDQISDTGGRRLAIYEYPYRDGQAIKDLGRKGEKFVFNIKFHGQNYQVLFEQFIKVVAGSKFPGTIIHPVRSGSSGAINVKFQDWEFLHRHDEFNSVTIKATFIEDSTDQLLQVNAQLASPDTGLRGALQTMASTQSYISQAISDTSALLLLPAAIKASMEARLTSINGQISLLHSQAIQIFNP